MAWNRANKALGGQFEKAIPFGAPVSNNPSTMTGRGYSDGWDIERAYRDGMKRVTWVYRCIDAIAGNQARLPVIGHGHNSPHGPIVNDDDVLQLLNSRSNPGEDAFVFRYRLSSQLLMSTRGAFVEMIRGKGGQVVALNLLPPQHTSPVPDPKNFVKSFEVRMPGGGFEYVKPEDVLWFRHPHPLDPYLSLTPMESAGIAIEIENLSKFYNRNFLLNDGRPGGLLVVRGDMDEDDKEELRSRFRGNIARAGAVTVVASEEGVDFVDTAASPRDAAYTEMRQITKEEILAAFGVPESVIGNASGRTFSNAAEELRVFWMETMQPHLEMLARGLDSLSPELYFAFDTKHVPILILAKQEREQYLMNEFQQGLITANEYRVGTGRQKVVSDLADSMLANPNLAPIGNTKRDMPYVDPNQMQGGGAPGAPGMPGAPPAGAVPAGAGPATPTDTSPAAAPLLNEAAPPEAAPAPETPPTPEAAATAADIAASPESTQFVGDAAPPQLGEPDTQDKKPPQLKSDDVIQTKDEQPSDFDVKTDTARSRWESILDRTLERYFERQQRVVLEKAAGTKARRSLNEGRLTVDAIFDQSVWDRQLAEDVRPVLAGIINDASGMLAEKADRPVAIANDEYYKTLDAQTERVQKVNDTTKEDLIAAIISAQALDGSEDEKSALLRAAIIAVFVAAIMRRRQRIAEIEAQSAFNGGMYLAGLQVDAQGGPRTDLHGNGSTSQSAPGKPMTKTWVAKKDTRVRKEHRLLDGHSVDIAKGFKVAGAEIRYPGDPLAPPHLSLGCRCSLRFQ